jgi:hypothetical protein
MQGCVQPKPRDLSCTKEWCCTKKWSKTVLILNQSVLISTFLEHMLFAHSKTLLFSASILSFH